MMRFAIVTLACASVAAAAPVLARVARHASPDRKAEGALLIEAADSDSAGDVQHGCDVYFTVRNTTGAGIGSMEIRFTLDDASAHTQRSGAVMLDSLAPGYEQHVAASVPGPCDATTLRITRLACITGERRWDCASRAVFGDPSAVKKSGGSRNELAISYDPM